jgi:predicted RecA/RadA family phage recombinase
MPPEARNQQQSMRGLRVGRALAIAQKEASQQTPPDDRYRRRAACDPAASGVIAMPRLRSRPGHRPRRCFWCISITQSRSTATLVDYCIAAEAATADRIRELADPPHAS